MITAIGFDADDTLWHNETIFQGNHRRFQTLLARYHDPVTVEHALFATEMRNLELYGYGVKSFALSSIETAIELTGGRIPAGELGELIRMAQEMLAHPVELIDGAAEIVAALAKDFTLLVITKGDLHHQERKFHRSGLAAHFADCVVLADKNARSYDRLLRQHDLPAERFLMVGNSLRSDILPVIELGGHAAFIPYPLEWDGEKAEPPAGNDRYHALQTLRDLPALVAQLNA